LQTFRRFHKVLPFFVIGLFFLFQIAFLSADTPLSFTRDMGTHIDEGFKTLDARNLALFGKTHWSEYDQYKGWVRGSPVTVAFNFLMFKLLGVSLAVARFSNLLFALATLAIFYVYLISKYDRCTSISCSILLAVNQVFFYSRLALFETKMLFFFVCCLYFMSLIKSNRIFFVFFILSCVAAYFSKATAILFFLSLGVYYLLTLKSGFVIRRVAKPSVLFIVLGLTLATLLGVEYNFEYFENIRIMGRELRSPGNAFLSLPPPEFFKKVPVLSFLALLYSGYLVLRIMEGRSYKEADILFMV
jgi:hypothetical protein